jgi:hypothetical protein
MQYCRNTLTLTYLRLTLSKISTRIIAHIKISVYAPNALAAGRRRPSDSGPITELWVLGQEKIIDMRHCAVNDVEFWPITSADQM